MSFGIARACLCAAAVSAATAGRGYGQLKPHIYTASYNDPHLSLRVTAGPRDSTLLLIHRADGTQNTLKLPHNPISVLTFQKAPANKVIIIADEGEPVVGVYVFDEVSSTITDEFRCFSNAAVSPDGRFIIFTRLSVLHGGDDEDRNDYAMLYDTSRTPAQNRPRRQMQSRWVVDNTGALIYPRIPKPQESKRGDLIVGHHFPRGYQWAPDSTKVAFFDEQVSNDPISAGAASDGKIIAGAKKPQGVVLNLVLVGVSSPWPNVRTLDTGLCGGDPGQPGCYAPQPIFTFGPTSVSFDTVPQSSDAKSLHKGFSYSAFRPS